MIADNQSNTSWTVAGDNQNSRHFHTFLSNTVLTFYLSSLFLQSVQTLWQFKKKKNKDGCELSE